MAEGEAQQVVYSPNAAHLVRTVQLAHLQLSAMADQKASLLMAATFVIFTFTIGHNVGTTPPLPLVILGAAAFLAAVCTILAVIPTIKGPKTGRMNLLFFGSFAELDEEEYVARIDEILRSDSDIYASMARDIYQNGKVLARKKYRLLGYAYRIFQSGLIASAMVFAFTYAGHAG